jgi:hypothetical protein
MSRIFGIHGEKSNAYSIGFWWTNHKERDHLRNLGVDGGYCHN